MNKGQLIEAVASELGDSKASATRALEAVINSITIGLKQDDAVTIVGFGTFSKKHRSARTGRTSLWSHCALYYCRDPRLSARAFHHLGQWIVVVVVVREYVTSRHVTRSGPGGSASGGLSPTYLDAGAFQDWHKSD